MHELTNREISFNRREIINIAGIDMGADMDILWAGGMYLVFKRQAYTCWSGTGSAVEVPALCFLIKIRHHGPRYLISEVVESSDNENALIAKGKYLSVASTIKEVRYD